MPWPLVAGENDEISVEIAQPDLTVAGVGVQVHVGDDAGLHFPDACDRGIEIVDLEPHCDTVAHRDAGIGEYAVVMLDLERVQRRSSVRPATMRSYSSPP
ncbi:MAG TPA: hypothetical protein VH062_15385 [Polyangiaceae bacterium]|nr:hypothetical protein [Polyangiaceae bacterium]